MAFHGYILRFKFNITRETSYAFDRDNMYYQTVELSLHMKDCMGSFVSYEDIESQINRHLDFYSGKSLNQIPPFDYLEPTLENIAKVFFEQLKFILSTLQYELYKLEIKEKSTRVFSVIETKDICSDHTI